MDFENTLRSAGVDSDKFSRILLHRVSKCAESAMAGWPAHLANNYGSDLIAQTVIRVLKNTVKLAQKGYRGEELERLVLRPANIAHRFAEVAREEGPYKRYWRRKLEAIPVSEFFTKDQNRQKDALSLLDRLAENRNRRHQQSEPLSESKIRMREKKLLQKLTPREREIVTLLRSGKKQREIKEQLGVRKQYVSRTIKTAIGKLMGQKNTLAPVKSKKAARKKSPAHA